MKIFIRIFIVATYFLAFQTACFWQVKINGNLPPNHHNKYIVDSKPLVSPKPTFFGPKPVNVIFMIGDGMGLSHITAGMFGNNNTLSLEGCSHVGLSKTYSASDLITDSAAGATALASGVKTYNGAVGLDANGQGKPTLLEAAELKGLSTGIITTCSATHATPACFYAHQPSRKMVYDIAADLLKLSHPVEVFIAGGQSHFDKRPDGLNLLPDLEKQGYTVKTNYTANFDSLKPPYIAFTAVNEPAKFTEGRTYLKSAVQQSLPQLAQNTKGFFLIVEGSQIDWAAHGNDTDNLIAEMIDFDHAIGAALNFANLNQQTLVVITADHETGGFAIDKGSVLNGPIKGGFVSTSHTGSMVPVFAYGPGAENFAGVYENTAIFSKIKAALELK